jgi:hypothetical protein
MERCWRSGKPRVLAGGTLVLAPSRLYLFRVFKPRPRYHEPTPR